MAARNRRDYPAIVFDPMSSRGKRLAVWLTCSPYHLRVHLQVRQLPSPQCWVPDDTEGGLGDYRMFGFTS